VCGAGQSWGRIIVYVNQFETKKLFLPGIRAGEGVPHEENGHHRKLLSLHQQYVKDSVKNES
jgi:hypothetical protein